jgi:hypothetical protein
MRHVSEKDSGFMGHDTMPLGGYFTTFQGIRNLSRILQEPQDLHTEYFKHKYFKRFNETLFIWKGYIILFLFESYTGNA